MAATGLTPIKSAVSSNKHVVRGDGWAQLARPSPPALHSLPTLKITLHFHSMHNKHDAAPRPNEAVSAPAGLDSVQLPQAAKDRTRLPEFCDNFEI